MTRYFHFTLGPVQGFVAQGRRTRDFWAGSFILSWLSAVAMKAVVHQGGKIVFPVPDPDFMEALSQGGQGPRHGNVPNRFMAEITDSFRPEQVAQTVQAAWLALAQTTWEEDLAGTPQETPASRAIWARQISCFWDIQWALADDANDTCILDRLKNWRTQLPPDEPGVKCMIMDGWQELSGAERPGQRTDDAAGPDVFWKGVRASGKHGMGSDLREGEHLCAIAFVKRRFARHFNKLQQTMPGDWQLRGWAVPTSVPSVHYLAAAPWLARLLALARNNGELSRDMETFHAEAKKIVDYGEWETDIRCVREAATGKLPRRWTALDGTVFFDAMLDNPRLWAEQAEQARKVKSCLSKVRSHARLDSVSPFYAVLLMDGDELGMQMSDANKRPIISQGLSRFTQSVPGIVDTHNGFLVYAGGDDVLALLPLEYALDCAASLRKHYTSCFQNTAISTSLSGAIEFAHIKMPLGKVLADAHALLDDVAKDGCGRDAIACRVWKPGGQALEWAMPWERALEEDAVVLQRMAGVFQQTSKSGQGDNDAFASKFFYRIRETFDLLNPADQHKPRILDDDQALALMAMEYLNSGSSRVKSMDAAKALIAPLLAQCRRKFRKREGSTVTFTSDPALRADGALLVRFLAHKGVER